MIKVDGLKGLSLVDVMDAGVERTFIVFSNTNSPRWYNRFLREGFQHCWVLYYDGYNWFKVEHNYLGLQMEMIVELNGWVFNQCQNISRYYANLPFYTVEEVDRDSLQLACKNYRRSKFLMVPSTCVELVKDWCAIRRYWLHTPYQLYKHILKLNSHKG
jgi:hypothetical protein